MLRGGEPVDPGAWNKALPIDGGTYRVSARAPGNAEWSSTITVGVEHDVKAIDIPKLKAAALEELPVAATDTDAAPAPAAQARSKLVPLVLGGAAVVLAGGAIGFELSARSTNSEIAAEKTNNDRRISLWHSANNKRYIAEGLAVAGLASAGVAVWLYLRPGAEAPPGGRVARVQLAPMVASDRAGLLVLARY